jgi:type I restriction enzyme M protein
MRKGLGDKRREVPLDRSEDILRIVADFKDGDTRTIVKDGKPEAIVVSKIFPTTHFGFRKITVERPLRLRFRSSPERIARLDDQRGFQALAQSKKKGAAGANEQAEGRAAQDAVRRLVRGLPAGPFEDRAALVRALEAAAAGAGLALTPVITRAIVSALSERDEAAPICAGDDGRPEPDPELRDTEHVPLAVPIATFFEREVTPHVPDAWIDTDKRDDHDGEVGLVGYEINFNRYFYRYTPPRPLEEIEAEIRLIEADILRMLAEVTEA